MRSLSHWDIVYPVIGVALDSAVGAAGSEVNMEVDVLLDLRFIPSASSDDKPSLPTAGCRGLGLFFFGVFFLQISSHLVPQPGGNPFSGMYNVLLTVWRLKLARVMTLTVMPFPCSNLEAV